MNPEDKVTLPRIKRGNPLSGLRKTKKNYHVLYYTDGKLRAKSTGTSDLTKAKRFRSRFHKKMIDEYGATYREAVGRPSHIEQAVIDDPDCDAGIYEFTAYKVSVNGKHLITTSDFEKAKRVRNEHILS